MSEQSAVEAGAVMLAKVWLGMGPHDAFTVDNVKAALDKQGAARGGKAREKRERVGQLEDQVAQLQKQLDDANRSLQRMKDGDKECATLMDRLGISSLEQVAVERETLYTALERALVNWSAERSWCRHCRTETAQSIDREGVRVPPGGNPHKHASTCPLAKAPGNANLRALLDSQHANALDSLADYLGMMAARGDTSLSPGAALMRGFDKLHAAWTRAMNPSKSSGRKG